MTVLMKSAHSNHREGEWYREEDFVLVQRVSINAVVRVMLSSGWIFDQRERVIMFIRFEKVEK